MPFKKIRTKYLLSKNDLTSGSIVKSLLLMSIPIVFANIMQVAYQITDTFWLGRLGEEAVAAVSLSFPIIFLIISLGGGLGIAGTILVAQYKGAKNQERVDFVAAQTIIMMLISAAAASIIGYLLARPLMELMGAEPSVLPEAVAYMKVSFAGLVFMFGFFVYQSLMRGVGDVTTPLVIVIGTVLLNLFLDPFFIFGYGPIPALGAAGAALATIGTQSLASIAGFIILLSGKYGIKLHLKHLRPDFKLVKRMFFLGLPASAEQSSRSGALAVMTFLVAQFGTTTIAAYGLGSRLLSFAFIPMMGLSMATSTLVGQNIGAAKIKRAEKTAITGAKLGFVVLTILGVIFFIFAEQISSLLIVNSPEVVAQSALFIRVAALTYGLIAIQHVFTGTLRGAGSTVAAMMVTVLSLWVVRFPLAYLLAFHTTLGFLGIWIAFPVTNILSVVMAWAWFKKGDWKKKKLTKEEDLATDVSEETIIEEGV